MRLRSSVILQQSQKLARDSPTAGTDLSADESPLMMSKKKSQGLLCASHSYPELNLHY